MTTSPALASNAGDRYHFVYVARRMLDLLYDRDLRLVEIEGVAEEDRHLATDASSFLAVDVTEYFGGETAKTAREVTVIQVKYSPTAPREAWTLARLTSEPKAVVRKLANAWKALRAEARSVTVRIVTNQPLDDTVRHAVERAKRADASRLSTLARKEPVLLALKEATELSWQLLASFLRDFDLSGFGHPSLADEQARLSWELQQTAHGDVDMHALVSRVQEAATPGKPTSFRLADVEMHLDVRHEELYPAPPRPDPPDRLFQTRDSAAAAAAILARSCGLLLLHGVGGIGKTSALQLLSRDYTGQAVVVVYDCYGNGEGVFVGSERFPYRKFFTQLTNELDAALGTSILTSTRLSYERLSTTFDRALSAAAALAAAAGKRLVIAIDAADNAALVAARSPIERNASFVPMLPFIRWPENCVAVVTTRTENLSVLGLPADLPAVDLNGFDAQETARHGRTFLPDASDRLLTVLHERTNGNARVQARVLEELVTADPPDRESYVVRRARETAFEFYQAAVADLSRLEARMDRLMLATIAEATQPIDTATVARIVGVDVKTIESFVRSLAFGLRCDNLLIRWRDQDFRDFAVSRLDDVRSEALERLADFAVKHYGTEPYAERNLSRHLYAAGRAAELLAFWLESDRLSQRIARAAPHTDAMAEDVRYALLAAQQMRRRTDVLHLLALAADLAQGRDVFLRSIAEFPDVAAREQLVDAIVANREGDERYRAPRYIELARALAEQGDLDGGRALYERAIAGYGADADRRFYPSEVVGLARCETALFGLRTAFERLDKWSKPVGEGFTEAVLRFVDRGGDTQELLGEIERLSADQRVHSFLGVLARADVLSLDAATCNRMAAAVGRGLKHGSGDNLPFVETIEALVRAQQWEAARVLLARSQKPAKPPTEEVDRELLRYLAMTEVLGGTPVAAADVSEDPRNPVRPDELARLYGSLRCRARAWAGQADDIAKEVDNAIEPWRSKRSFLASPRSTLPSVTREVVEAVLMLPERHPEPIREVLELLEREFDDPTDRRYDLLAEALSRDGRYSGEAERLIRTALQALQPREAHASLVYAILKLYAPAARIDTALAKDVFRRARQAANAIDATIEARTGALLDVAGAAESASGFAAQDLYRIASVVEYEQRKVRSANADHRRRVLAQLATADAAAAFALAEAWDDAALADIAPSMPAIAQGLVGARSVPPLAVFALAEMAGPDEALPVLERGLHSLRDDLRPRFFRRLVAYVLRQPGNERYRLLARIGEADSVPDEVRAEVQAIVEQAATQEVPERLVVHNDTDAPRAEVESPLDAVRMELRSSPSRALQTLRHVLKKERTVLRHELEPLVLQLFAALPSAKQAELVELVAEGSARAGSAPYVLSLLATTDGLVGSELRDTIRAAARRCLIPENLREVSEVFRHQEFEALRVCWSDDPDLFDLLAEVLGNNADRIGANAMYQWIGRLATLLPPDVALTALRGLVDRMEAEVPCPRSPSWRPADSALHAIVRALADLLGHPRVAERWRAVYALADLALEGNDERVVPLLIRELSDDRHRRWMTKCEWLLFTLQHLAVRRAELLVPHVAAIAKHALSDFPHAVLREHAKETVLAISAEIPDAVDAETLATLAKVNEPIGFVCRTAPPDNSEPSGTQLFQFDWEAMTYWYEPVAEAFNRSSGEIAASAADWIVAKWGLSSEICERERETDPHKYDWLQVMVVGSRPVETLQTYVERHALALAAGALIDTTPAVDGKSADKGSWTTWLREHGRVSDPFLPGRFLVSPPNHGFAATRHRFVHGGEWVTVASDWYENKSNVISWLRSALVPKDGAPDEADLSEFLEEPDSNLFVSELEQAARSSSAWKRFITSIQTTFGHDSADPRWPHYERVYFLPGPGVQQQFGLIRPDRTGFEWWRAGEPVVRVEFWFDKPVYGNRTRGTRLIMRADFLRDVMKETGCDIHCRYTIAEYPFPPATENMRLSELLFVGRPPSALTPSRG